MLGVLAQKFDWFQTFRNNSQQHATGCANGRNISNTQHGVANIEAFVCTGLEAT